MLEITDAILEAGGKTLYECIQCGTCSSLCPWNEVSDYSPRHLIHEVSLGIEGYEEEALWKCVTCNLCVSRCPRGIDMVDIIRAARTTMLEMGSAPAAYRGPLASMNSDGNPWNGNAGDRMKWAEGLDLDVYTPENEYLYFTCCTQAFDPRNKPVAKALTGLLKDAGVNFGISGPDSVCCGDQASKVGGRSTFEALKDKNLAQFAEGKVDKIIVASPHCLNAFLKDYAPDTRGVAVEHYTVTLDRLIAQGAIKPTTEVAHTVAYHDPCYLGRHNNIYDEPRRVLQAIPGVTLVEMEHTRANSLCCGGGGGGLWLEVEKEERFAILRVQEAIDAGADTIATACPYCTIMFEDAVKVMNAEDKIAIRDVSELLAQSLA
jgi:Fe-S oxidoreductase